MCWGGVLLLVWVRPQGLQQALLLALVLQEEQMYQLLAVLSQGLLVPGLCWTDAV